VTERLSKQVYDAFNEKQKRVGAHNLEVIKVLSVFRTARGVLSAGGHVSQVELEPTDKGHRRLPSGVHSFRIDIEVRFPRQRARSALEFRSPTRALRAGLGSLAARGRGRRRGGEMIAAVYALFHMDAGFTPPDCGACALSSVSEAFS